MTVWQTWGPKLIHVLWKADRLAEEELTAGSWEDGWALSEDRQWSPISLPALSSAMAFLECRGETLSPQSSWIGELASWCATIMMVLAWRISPRELRRPPWIYKLTAWARAKLFFFNVLLLKAKDSSLMFPSCLFRNFFCEYILTWAVSDIHSTIIHMESNVCSLWGEICFLTGLCGEGSGSLNMSYD